MRILLCLICCSAILSLNAQKIGFQILPSSGVIAHNLIENEFDSELIKGWSVINSIDFRISYKHLEKSNFSTSLGYMHSLNLGLESIPLRGFNAFAHYASVKFGYLRQIAKKQKLGVNISNYIFLEPDNKAFIQQNYFGNIDLIYDIEISKYLNFGVSTPITFSPFASYTGERLGSFDSYNLWSEWIGLQFYLGVKIF